MGTRIRKFRRLARRGVRGFSLLDSALAITLLALTSALALPTAGTMLDRARLARAQMEVNAIAVAIMEYARDTGRLPGDDLRGGQAEQWLVLGSKGAFPPTWGSTGAQLWEMAPRADLIAYLRYGGPDACARWNGPYLPDNLGADPWGQTYLVNIGCAASASDSGPDKRAVFVISAGPDGVLETPMRQPVSSAKVSGDDIAVRIQ